MKLSRRDFVRTAALAATSGTALKSWAQEEKPAADPLFISTWPPPLFVSTWAFGKACNETALETMRQGRGLLDAVERGIWVMEDDAGDSSVGLGGTPNAEGVVQLDACIMWGPEHGAGSVAALEGIAHPISVARRVMEQTPHVMLVGDGARRFALEQGFEDFNLLTDERREAWRKWREKKQAVQEDGHDTVALLGLAADGTIAGGCSTSGWGYKLPGRTGDSPIIGSGLYVDNDVGAAGATGLGENVMRYCATFMVVEFMRQGLSPGDACLKIIERIVAKEPAGKNLSINFIALDKQGRYGAAGTDTGFKYAVATPAWSRVLEPQQG